MSARSDQTDSDARFMRDASDRLFDVLGIIGQVRGTVRAITCLGSKDSLNELAPEDALPLFYLLEDKLVEIEGEVDKTCLALSNRGVKQRANERIKAQSKTKKRRFTVVTGGVSEHLGSRLDSGQMPAAAQPGRE